MEFSASHTERRQQISVLQEESSVRYVELKTQYDDLYKEMIDYKTRAHFWETQFNRVKPREELLKAEIEELKAKLRKREQQLFGTKSEKNTQEKDLLNQSQVTKSTKKKKGQQAGSKGHGKRDYSYLPTVEETIGLYEKDAICPCCKLPYDELADTDDSELLEIINVKAYRRVLHRKKYKRNCDCKENKDPKIMTPAPNERLIPKCKLGSSLWALLLLKKFEYQQPLHRALAELNGSGLSLAKGTVTDGFQRLLPLFITIYDAIVEHSVSSKVLIDYFGANHEGGTLNVDRYSAYKVIAKSGLFILAFCWAHVRRDFLNYSKEYPNDEKFGLEWVKRINLIFHRNNQRIQYEVQSKEFIEHDQALKDEITAMKQSLSQTLQNKELMPSAKKLLVSLEKHWSGLIVFVERPEIPMDNNAAERGLRGSVVGRKNYYGSGAIWSAELAAALFTLFGTLKLWKLNIHTWLLGYFNECALLGGQPPDNIKKYLPWNMTDRQKLLFSEPPKHENPI